MTKVFFAGFPLGALPDLARPNPPAKSGYGDGEECLYCAHRIDQEACSSCDDCDLYEPEDES